MEFDAAKLDSPISPEHLADYWREKAECLEEWVCELLRKNHALRMNSFAGTVTAPAPGRSNSAVSSSRLDTTTGSFNSVGFHDSISQSLL